MSYLNSRPYFLPECWTCQQPQKSAEFYILSHIEHHTKCHQPLVKQFLDVWPLWALRLSDGAAFFQGSRCVTEAPAEDVQVSIALVTHLRVGCEEGKELFSPTLQLCHGRGSPSPTDWGEFGGTEGTRDVVDIGWGQNPSIAALPSFSSICHILFTCLYGSSSLQKRDGRWRCGGAGEDRFTIDYREGYGFFMIVPVTTLNTDLLESWVTCFDRCPVAKWSIVFRLRLLEVHAVDGAAVHGGRTLPGRLGPGGVVGNIGTDGHRRWKVGSLSLWRQRRRLGWSRTYGGTQGLWDDLPWKESVFCSHQVQVEGTIERQWTEGSSIH